MNKTIPQPNGDAKKVNKKYSIIKDSLTKTSSNGFEVIHNFEIITFLYFISMNYDAKKLYYIYIQQNRQQFELI